ncbi:serine/arginine repetitive matrix protein 1-like [Macrobrachium nipponense]|uniref:serine/arginine repetitive matrix protein 1-like n=1 Tax=Macrobrachium nipponense TaxID=159736 RepID=UPI0030C82182
MEVSFFYLRKLEKDRARKASSRSSSRSLVSELDVVNPTVDVVPSPVSAPAPSFEPEDSCSENAVRSNECKVRSYKDPVARSQAALDRAKKEVLRQCFLSSSSPSAKRRWSASESSRPLKRTWKEPCALPSSPESFSEEPEIECKRTRRSQGSSSPFRARASTPAEEFERSPARILAGLQAQISALANSLAESSHRRKDISLPVKKSKKDSADFSPNVERVQEPRSRASFIKERLSRSPSRRSSHASRRKDLDRRSSPEYRSPNRSPKTRSSSCKRQEFDKYQDSRSVQDRSRRSLPGSCSPLHRRTETSRRFSPDFVSSPEIRSPSVKLREDSRRKEPSKRQTRLSPPCERTRSDRQSVPRKRIWRVSFGGCTSVSPFLIFYSENYEDIVGGEDETYGVNEESAQELRRLVGL